MTERNDPRHGIEVWGSYRTPNGGKRDVVIKDISESGCRFFDKFSGLLPDQEIYLKIDTLGPFLVSIRWNRSGYVGAEFDHPLYGPVFDHIRTKLGGPSAAPQPPIEPGGRPSRPLSGYRSLR